MCWILIGPDTNIREDLWSCRNVSNYQVGRNFIYTTYNTSYFLVLPYAVRQNSKAYNVSDGLNRIHIEFAAAIFDTCIPGQRVISYSAACLMAISKRMWHCIMPVHRQYCKKSLIPRNEIVVANSIWIQNWWTLKYGCRINKTCSKIINEISSRRINEIFSRRVTEIL